MDKTIIDYYNLIRFDVIDLVPKNKVNILDLGCGSGFTGAELRKRNNAFVIGVELFPDAAEEASKKLDRVICGDIEQMNPDIAPESIDCIICADVLEHLKDPEKVLDKLRIFLKKDGILVASIPNIQNLRPLLKIITNKLEYADSGILDRTHLRFFTYHTIEKMFADTGFEIVSVINKHLKRTVVKLINLITFSLFKRFFVYQYLVTVKKKN